MGSQMKDTMTQPHAPQRFPAFLGVTLCNL